MTKTILLPSLGGLHRQHCGQQCHSPSAGSLNSSGSWSGPGRGSHPQPRASLNPAASSHDIAVRCPAGAAGLGRARQTWQGTAERGAAWHGLAMLRLRP